LKLFHLYRSEDETGVSGTGPVVEGVQFTNGWCAIRWLSERSTLCFYQSIEDVKVIHGHGGRTELIVHDFEAPNRSAARGEGPFEVFLQAIEQLSAAVNLAEESGSTCEEVRASFTEVRALVDELENRLELRVRKSA
jgi:hypothetical protein